MLLCRGAGQEWRAEETGDLYIADADNERRAGYS